MGVMYTLTVIGPATSRLQAQAILKQIGLEVDGSDYPNGYPLGNREACVTAHLLVSDSTQLGAVNLALEPISWQVRMHSARQGDWAKVGNHDIGVSSANAEVAKLRSQLKALGLALPEDK